MKIISNSEFSALLNPRLAVLVTCCDMQGHPNVLAVAWHTPLSHDPPLLGISIGLTRYSHKLIQSTGEFVVNVMSASMLPAVRICGEYTGELDDKFSLAKLKTKLASKISIPVLSDALAFLECKLENQIETGDHTFFIGRVLHASLREDRFKQGWLLEQQDGALLVLQSDRYVSIGKEIFDEGR